MKIGIASDHGGFLLKESLKEYLLSMQYDIIDYGTNTQDSVDYPDYAQKVAQGILSHQTQFGILICSSGVGMSIAANRYKGIRAVLCQNEQVAKSSREHNDCNVIVFGEKIVSQQTALECLKIFLNTDDDKDSRHKRRIKKLDEID